MKICLLINLLVWNSYLVFVDWYAIPLDCTHCFDGVFQQNQVWLHFERCSYIRIHFINSCHHFDLWFPSRSRSDWQRVRPKFIFHKRCESYVNKFVEFNISEYLYKEWTYLLYCKPWPHASVYFIGLAFGHKKNVIVF